MEDANANYLTCPHCNAELQGHYVERGGLVCLQIGGVLLERGTCANCGKRLFFSPSDEPLPAFITRAMARRAEIDAQIKALADDVRRPGS